MCPFLIEHLRHFSLVFKDRDRPVEQSSKTTEILDSNCAILFNIEIILSIWDFRGRKEKCMKRFFFFLSLSLFSPLFSLKQFNDFQQIEWLEQERCRRSKKSTFVSTIPWAPCTCCHQQVSTSKAVPVLLAEAKVWACASLTTSECFCFCFVCFLFLDSRKRGGSRVAGRWGPDSAVPSSEPACDFITMDDLFSPSLFSSYGIST